MEKTSPGLSSGSACKSAEAAGLNRRLSPQELLVREYLDLAMEQFSGSMVGARTIRRFAVETPDLFCNAGLVLLLQREPSALPIQYLMSQLLQQQDLMRAVSDPWRFNREHEVMMFKLLLARDPSLDIRLAKSLPQKDASPAEGITGEGAERALDILDVTSSGRRIVQILSHLMDYPNPRIASKAMLVIGKRIQNVDWAEKQVLTQTDSRSRANAIETIWGVDTNQAKRVLAQAAHDPNNRVAGNSAFGLHVLGDARSSALAKRMAYEAAPSFRSTAAWVMGQIGDPEFLGPLKDLIRDDNPAVKSASLRSILHIRREQMRLEAIKPQVVAQEEVTEKQQEAVKQLENDVARAPEINLRLDGRQFATRRSRR